MSFSRKITVAVLGVMTVLSCQRVSLEDAKDANLVPLAVSVGRDAKSVMDGFGNVLFEEGDEISIWDGRSVRKFITETGTVEGAAVFHGYVDESASELTAVYPYDPDLTVVDGQIRTWIPTVQEAVPGSFGPQANVMVGRAMINNPTFYMKNISSLIRVEIAAGSETEELLVTGLNGEALTGPVSVALDGSGVPSVIASRKIDVITEDKEGSGEKYVANEVRLRKSGYGAIPQGTYYLTVMATGDELTEGLRLLYMKGVDKSGYSASLPALGEEEATGASSAWLEYPGTSVTLTRNRVAATVTEGDHDWKTMTTIAIPFKKSSMYDSSKAASFWPFVYDYYDPAVGVSDRHYYNSTGVGDSITKDSGALVYKDGHTLNFVLDRSKVDFDYSVELHTGKILYIPDGGAFPNSDKTFYWYLNSKHGWQIARGIGTYLLLPGRAGESLISVGATLGPSSENPIKLMVQTDEQTSALVKGGRGVNGEGRWNEDRLQLLNWHLSGTMAGAPYRLCLKRLSKGEISQTEDTVTAIYLHQLILTFLETDSSNFNLGIEDYLVNNSAL